MASKWWRNWTSSYGYLAGTVHYPRTLEELAKTIHDAPSTAAIRAVGGGWSGSDVALPFRSIDDVEAVSIASKASKLMENWHDDGPLLDGFGGVAIPIDRTPMFFDRVAQKAHKWDEGTGTWVPDPGGLEPHLPAPPEDFPKFDQLVQPRDVQLIDTRHMKSSLQTVFQGIRHVESLQPGAASHLFHVEAGILMKDLSVLLDHQSPRMALRSTSGSPGATLAGALSTGTHGAEVKDDLLVDTVMAIHLVDARGDQWWIEGETLVADPKALTHHYPGLSPERIIQKGQPRCRGGWRALSDARR